ncbi:hypothetical protein OIN59_03400 [Acidovorax sp. D2M1]|uniref:NfeD-like C-terminal domain-containing protein n=1 Tax=Acidovorax benzenivorans TaxID=2987520 RepID=A0ABT5RRY8_9BURK|nr:hypothetical protein [Acidovorax benzenivorans]MDD2176464.1 hypothetical protein [Acidovorax benzenivorans]
MERWEVVERAVLLAVGVALLGLCGWLVFVRVGPERFVGLALLAPCVYWVFWQALHTERKKSINALSDFQEPKTSADHSPFARAEADMAKVFQQGIQLECQGQLDERVKAQIDARLREISDQLGQQVVQQLSSAPAMGRQCREPRWKLYVASLFLLALAGGVLEIAVGTYFIPSFGGAYQRVFPMLLALAVPIFGFLLFRIERQQNTLAGRFPSWGVRWIFVFPAMVLACSFLVLLSPYGWSALAGWMVGADAPARQAKVLSVEVAKPKYGKCDQHAALVIDGTSARICIEGRSVGELPKAGDTVSVRGRSSFLGLFVEEVRVERQP